MAIADQERAGSDEGMGEVNLPAWEDPAVSFPLNLVETWRRSVFEPGAFFADGPFEHAAVRPVLYYLVISVLTAALSLTWGALLPATQAGFVETLAEIMNVALPAGAETAGAIGRLADFFLAPFWAVLYLIIASLVLHVFVLVLVPRRRSITATVRTICYACGPGVFAIVPFIGGWVAGIWGIVLTVIGLREAHRTTTGRAFAAWLLAAALPIAFVLLGILLVIARVASGV
ncbi:YIP1 family protein [Candidatus Palauibacter irciniicola]|uniref:YIP1 family protein n=1 Tax=Candidatus Palauibacter irciniicola TaxID=3056733 RepID=UPI003B01EFC6